MQDVMIDIETLDTRPSAVILSIGAVRFDVEAPGSFGERFHVYVDIDSNLEADRTVSGSTILWWIGQSENARERIVNGKAVSLRIALARLSEVIKQTDRVWGNGAGFDNVILADAYRTQHMAQPWRYWSDMCYRTLKVLHSHVPKPEVEGVAHDALDDAIAQALHLQMIFASMK